MAISERIHADFTQRVILRSEDLPWIPSPQAGVNRRLLDRIGGEVARATSIVRYTPDSHFPAHTHGGGEEFFVLNGTFSDEHGDYPAGTYVRNPPGSSHTPFTKDGCTIFVKLRQMQPDDKTHIAINTEIAKWSSGDNNRLSKLPLFAEPDNPERVELIRLASHTQTSPYICNGGEEILVLSGTLEDSEGTYGPGTWIRNPPGFYQHLQSEAGATYWRKQGHLATMVQEGTGG